MTVTALGYVGLSSSDLAGWARFGREVLGAEASIVDDEVRIRLDERAWRLSVRDLDGPPLAFLGLEARDLDGLAAVAATLESAGHEVVDAPDLADRRQVTRVLRTVDPSGNVIEVFVGATVDPSPFRSSHATSFVTGDEGLGHAVLVVDDVGAALAFWVDALGFAVRDVLVRDGRAFAWFLGCNPRHHTIALMEGPPEAVGVQHLMLQVGDLDQVGRAMDRARHDEVPLITTLGRHSNDQMLSFYLSMPGGIALEYGCEGLRVDPGTWSAIAFERASDWGHRPVHDEGST
jgi:2,3-dihydroxybiphenyl 1,2-dioxygenase